MVASAKTLHVSVWRGVGASGHFDDFAVPRQPSQTVLDVVAWIQQNAEPELSYRYACRVGMCGSCAMTINGEPRWTCRTHVDKVESDGKLTIAPLRNLPVIRDLVTDMDPFFEKWRQAEGIFHPTETRDDKIPRVSPESPARREADLAIECINCGVCYGACDTVTGNSDYLGPAALNRAWSLINDEKDGGRANILKAASSTRGCHNCHSQGSCATYCPVGLNPIRSIAGLKRETVKWFLKGGA